MNRTNNFDIEKLQILDIINNSNISKWFWMLWIKEVLLYHLRKKYLKEVLHARPFKIKKITK